MTSLNPEKTHSPPICLPAYRIPEKKTVVAVWCPHCGLLHHHGEGPGRLFFHRMAHCVRPADGEDASPFRASGYFVIPTGCPLPLRTRTGAAQSGESYEETPHPLPGDWARPLPYKKAVDHIVEWYLQEGHSREEIARALAEFEWMYERTARKYLGRSERPVV